MVMVTNGIIITVAIGRRRKKALVDVTVEYSFNPITTGSVLSKIQK
jgi:hypothetical protein